jgi:DNA-binding XRE family transcriptional regulator
VRRDRRNPPHTALRPCPDIAFSVRLDYRSLAGVHARAPAATTPAESRTLSQTAQVHNGEHVRGLPGLRAAREAKLLTQHELAAAAGVNPSTISQLEAGNRNAHLRTIRVLASALSVSAQELLASATPMRRPRRRGAASLGGAPRQGAS